MHLRNGKQILNSISHKVGSHLASSSFATALDGSPSAPTAFSAVSSHAFGWCQTTMPILPMIATCRISRSWVG